MKSLAELAVMKEKARDQVAMREGNFDFKIVHDYDDLKEKAGEIASKI